MRLRLSITRRHGGVPAESVNEPGERFDTFEEYVDHVSPGLTYDDPGILEFLRWCVEDTLDTTGSWPNSDEFWAYYHAAHVHTSGGPLS